MSRNRLRASSRTPSRSESVSGTADCTRNRTFRDRWSISSR